MSKIYRRAMFTSLDHDTLGYVSKDGHSPSLTIFFFILFVVKSIFISLKNAFRIIGTNWEKCGQRTVLFIEVTRVEISIRKNLTSSIFPLLFPSLSSQLKLNILSVFSFYVSLNWLYRAESHRNPNNFFLVYVFKCVILRALLKTLFHY